MELQTKCVQAGYSPKNGEPRVMPIVQSTTFYYDSPEEMGELFDLKKEGFFYTRLGNPTLAALEAKVNALEGGVGALATSSGMSATMIAALNLLAAGDNFLSATTVYGGTFNLFDVTLRRMGMDCRFFALDAAAEEIEAKIDEKTRFVFVETLANPAMEVADFEKLSGICKKHGLVLMVDNTLATPVICRPFEHGANVVVHSTTKYIDGHATSVGGMVVDGGNFDFSVNPRYPEYAKADESYHGLVFGKQPGAFISRARALFMRDLGAQMSPMNAFLTMLGSETLHLRMPAISANALAIAEVLSAHPMVEWVKYPGLKTDANHQKAMRYFDNGQCSGMVTFGIKGGRENAVKFQKALKLVAIVTHIADSRSCVLHPASTTHRQLSAADLIACGISEGLIRLSIGTESTNDIVADIVGALNAIQ